MQKLINPLFSSLDVLVKNEMKNMQFRPFFLQIRDSKRGENVKRNTVFELKEDFK